MRVEALRVVGRSSAAVCVCALLALAFGAWQQTTRSDAAGSKHCSLVVTKAGDTKYSKALVLILEGKVDCEKARKAIFSALSATKYSSRQIGGWTCRSTNRAAPSGPYGAECVKENPYEVIKSTTPQPCQSCTHIRD
jgi:hypothetical protein